MGGGDWEVQKFKENNHLVLSEEVDLLVEYERLLPGWLECTGGECRQSSTTLQDTLEEACVARSTILVHVVCCM